MTPEELLLKAAEDHAAHGHTKEQFYGVGAPGGWETAPACAYGSLARVAGAEVVDHHGSIIRDVDNSVLAPAATMLADHIRAKFPHIAEAAWGDVYSTITTFNDHRDTTGEDVILAMKEAAHG